MELTDRAAGSRAVPAYLGLLVFHAAHILEEVFGRFVVLHKLGLAGFLAANWVLFCVPVVFFYFWLVGRRWARRMSVLYAAFMILNGLGHNVMTLTTGRYFDGYAGGLSGIGLVIAGTVFLRSLRPEESGEPKRSRRSVASR